MNAGATLRGRAEAEASRLPPLFIRADQLSGTFLLGEHGRRRAGIGDDFWQYRPAAPGDEHRNIDWRRSARSDMQYVRQLELKIARNILIWMDGGSSMRFSSHMTFPEKIDRARLLSLAVAILLNRAGERVGLMGMDLPPKCGETQLARISVALEQMEETEYGGPPVEHMPANGSALFISDFLGSTESVRDALATAAAKGVWGVMLQLLDPAEEAFPYRGRTLFESVGGGYAHETANTYDLQNRYLERLAERKAELKSLCAAAGWQYGCFHTTQNARSMLLWLYRAIEGAHRE